MKANITFVSASAGSGKTYRITEIMEEKLTRGACRTGGLVATTFTVKAAQEFRKRVRRRLYDAGQGIGSGSDLNHRHFPCNTLPTINQRAIRSSIGGRQASPKRHPVDASGLCGPGSKPPSPRHRS